jgi:hypothetical protein
MRRDQVIQPFLDLFEAPSYLEIGVSHGATFHALNAARKVAVDPHFQFLPASRAPGAEYHEVPSDDYFESLVETPPHFDVVYLDGLHTFEQTLRDLINTLGCIGSGGVIIIDDVLPSSYDASLQYGKETLAVRTMSGSTDRAWMGDVYRLVFFIQSFCPAFYYATVADNHGQLVMWRGKRDKGQFRPRLVEQVARLDYRHVVMERDAFNLQRHSDIIKRAHGDLSRPCQDAPP